MVALSGWTAAQAADDLLALLPKQTLGLVVVNRLAQTDAKVVSLGTTVQLPAPSFLSVLKMQAGISAGLDEKEAAVVVAVGGEELDDEVAVLLYVPVTDYQQFIQQLQPKEVQAGLSRVELWKSPFLVRQVKNYAVFGELGQRELLAEGLSNTAAPDELLAWAQFLRQNDLSAALTHRGLQVVIARLQQYFNNIKEMLDDAPAAMKPAQATVDMYLRLLPTIEREVQGLAGGLSAEKSGTLRLELRGRLNPAGWLAPQVAACGPAPGDLLAGLPAKPFVFAAGGSVPQPLVQGLLSSLKGARSAAVMMAAIDTDTPLCRDLIGVVRADDPQEDLRGSLKAISALMDNRNDAPIKSYHLDDAKIQDHDALRLTFTIPRTQQLVQGFDELLDKLVGTGGRIVTYLIAADRQHLVFACQAKKELLQQACDALKPDQPGLSADAQAAQTAALLPRNPLAVAYFSPPGAITVVNRFLTQLPPFRAAPDFPAVPAIGFALTSAPAELQGHLVLPVEVLRAIRGYTLQMAAAQAGAQPPAPVAVPKNSNAR
jgi:hypothetical protein